MFKKLIITFFCFCLYLSNCLANQVEFSFYKKGLFSFSSMVPFSFDCIGNGKNNFILFGRHSGIAKLLIEKNNKHYEYRGAFADLRDNVLLGGEDQENSMEEGILDFAFSYDFNDEKKVYITYTNKFGNFILSRFNLTSNCSNVIIDSEEILIDIEKHTYEHASGSLDFSPKDKFLYVGIGDGDIAGNPSGTAQNKKKLEGKILRIDVSSNENGYLIPTSNPFYNSKSRPEIWAYGLRATSKSGIIFDTEIGDLYIADTGWDNFEEINFQESESKGGENYGWNKVEGLHCRGDIFDDKEDCLNKDFKWPVIEWDHQEGCSVIAGGVFRGDDKDWNGTFIFSDFCSGIIKGLKKIDNEWYYSDLYKTSINPHSIIRTFDNSFFVTDRFSGDIYKINFQNFNKDNWMKINNLIKKGELYSPNTEIQNILNSTSWKITQPLRNIISFFKFNKKNNNKDAIEKTVEKLKDE
ncbi:MAG: Soluble aldose sugar dehydrogenase YliI [Alphaproteobacteria bacterium MarineAlpha6_Bin6]|nr:hypothetical protein [Pelagibacteraceae bacterium]PPR29298.1 MAG: Soluble aldose sugar dehydrogenase YliI [Alphaproteobacteria bacterium MarineAlpha6_Bin6]PPR33131.1 MAG: Soluble aldose sugar dehydrogenase YliI [Alphaproteobacteria bacterium MarineAlpha6_Bin5]